MKARPKPAVGRALGALRIADRTAWATRVRVTLREHKRRLQPAAKALEISTRTLQRWAIELRLPAAPRGRPRKVTK